jgi:hypothetical protein
MSLANRFLSFPFHPVFLTGCVLNVGSKYLQCDSHISDLRYLFPDQNKLRKPADCLVCLTA